jgi:hypothetical protein
LAVHFSHCLALLDRRLPIRRRDAERIHSPNVQVFQLVKARFLKATSVGVQTERFTENRTRGGYVFREQSLAEFSIVNVPVTPAWRRSRRSVGVLLDHREIEWLPAP